MTGGRKAFNASYQISLLSFSLRHLLQLIKAQRFHNVVNMKLQENPF